ncbi:MAG TPA: efflux RND transporter periplasmic adaptor subunit [Stenomitos sp.]
MEPSSKKLATYRLVTGIAVAAIAVYGVTAKPWDHLGQKSKTDQTQVAPVADDYTCSMHHQVHSEHPGSCPICGMTLVKRSTLAPAHAASASAAAASPMPAGLNEVSLSPEQQVLANVKTEAVALHAIHRSLSTPGRITFDETRLAQVAARVNGRIERLYVNSTGAMVVQGRPMGTIYSPDVVATMEEYLAALKSYRQLKDNPYADLAESSKSLVAASRERLRLWGITDAQIARLERTGAATITLELAAPRTGVVTKKQVQPGQYVKEGDVLYDIADLSQVWVEADVFEADMHSVQVGQGVEVTTPSFPGKTFRGRISFIYPFLNPESRTVKVRATIPNPGMRLKPDMFVTAGLVTAQGTEQLAVPASAVLDTGRRKIVYVEVSPGVFHPREVSLGLKAEDYYPVISGLAAGEKVAVSGGFLLDAASQIQAGGSQAMPGMDHGDKPSDGATPMPGMDHGGHGQ